MFSFQSELIKTDVTAVKILQNYYLIGVAGFLHVFDKNYKLLTKINVLEGQKIYGIVPNEEKNNILLYGGKYIKVIETEQNLTEVKGYSATNATDWILSAKWIEDSQKIITVSMHNRLQIWSSNLNLITEVKCEEKCILYSAFICYNKYNDLVILSGTVFSEVLIWRPQIGRDSPILKRLQKHKGVIFSVHYNETLNYICSSSDDRSAVLWKPKRQTLLDELQQDCIEINTACHVFGHLARIFRCQVLDRYFLTAGEDSFLNIWSFDGKLFRKIETHQGGPIWALDAVEEDNNILTGGSDCAVTLFPINCNTNEQELSVPNKEVPKSVSCLLGSNLVVFSESGTLYYYVRDKKKWFKVQNHEDLKSYALVEVSKCRNMVALAGFQGQIYIYKQQKNTLHNTISSETKNKSRIFALHWISCTTILICQTEGKLTLYTLKSNIIIPISNFILPPSKERWSTTAVFTGKNFVVGDRKGNLHLFEMGKLEPVQTLKKVHSHLGVTNLIVRNDKVTSLGRNSVMKTFELKSDRLHLTCSDKMPFTWLLDIFGDLLLAFSSDKFILWNYETKRLIFEKYCGGGHRSWNFLKTDNDILFCYIKDKAIHLVNFNLNNFTPIDLIEGYQVKEINTLETIKVFNNYIVISGGEDTTLRINLIGNDKFTSLISLKSHLSSIRTITTHKLNKINDETKETYLIFSGGGRAQIICWKLEIFTTETRLKHITCSEQHSYYKNIDNGESETRIMDLNVINIQNELLLLAACSDGNIKIFFITMDEFGKFNLKFCRDLFYKLKCILKLCNMLILSQNILVTMATDGQLVFWDISDVYNNTNKLKYFHSIPAHQSGINSYDFKMLTNHLSLFLTGGDDNAIVLNLIRFQKTENIAVGSLDVFKDTGTHCAQITGVFLSDKYFLTASIDQRIAVFKWEILDEKIMCSYITKYNTAVADIQGLSCFENNDFDVFVYGKGLEYLKVKEKL